MTYVGLALAIFAGLLLYMSTFLIILWKVTFNAKFMRKIIKKYKELNDELEDLEWED